MHRQALFLRVMLGSLFLGAALALLLWPHKDQPTASSSFRQHITTVQVARVEQVTTKRTIRFSGITRAARRAMLAFSIPGRLLTRPVEVGSRVPKGFEIASIDVREYQNMVNMAQARVGELQIRAAQAIRDQQRIQQLAEERVAPTENLEQATAATDALHASLAAAKAQLDEARRAVKETSLKAPFSGTITAVFLEPDEYASPGKPIASLAGDGGIELQVEVPENMVSTLTEGDPVRVFLPIADGKEVTGRITSVAHAADPAKGLFLVVVTLDPLPELVPGMTTEVILEVTRKGELTLPVTAILNPGSSRPYVFAVHNKVVHRVPVVLRSFSGDRIVVQGSLSPGDAVVVSGHTMLTDGDTVQVAS
ncbi:MAG: hypothetical protein CSA21_04255 [Deltaproteobacteria bacterium]|nr:MAG: hypothetical protein CSA21_04255 [Deltaproteobacteria bacterium]